MNQAFLAAERLQAPLKLITLSLLLAMIPQEIGSLRIHGELPGASKVSAGFKILTTVESNFMPISSLKGQ